MDKTWRTDLDNMVYIIRNEGTASLERVMQYTNTNNLKIKQERFISELRYLMGSLFTKASIIVIDMQEQLNKAYRDLEGLRTISLDTYFNGTYNLEITRLFEIRDKQTKFKTMTSRFRDRTIEEQIEDIEPGEYIIVDDDAVGGRTIREVARLLGSDRKVIGTYLMMDTYRNKSNQPILDVVDCRDFIVGSSGGLTVDLPDVGIVRLPYLYPFVDINDKANIPEGMEQEFSNILWDLNKELYRGLNLKLENVSEHFIKISNTLKIKNNTPMEEVCDIYKELVHKGLIFSN